MSELLFFEVSVVDLVHRLEQPCLERLKDDSPWFFPEIAGLMIRAETVG